MKVEFPKYLGSAALRPGALQVSSAYSKDDQFNLLIKSKPIHPLPEMDLSPRYDPAHSAQDHTKGIIILPSKYSVRATAYAGRWGADPSCSDIRPANGSTRLSSVTGSATDELQIDPSVVRGCNNPAGPLSFCDSFNHPFGGPGADQSIGLGFRPMFLLLRSLKSGLLPRNLMLPREGGGYSLRYPRELSHGGRRGVATLLYAQH